MWIFLSWYNWIDCTRKVAVKDTKPTQSKLNYYSYYKHDGNCFGRLFGWTGKRCGKAKTLLGLQVQYQAPSTSTFSRGKWCGRGDPEGSCPSHLAEFSFRQLPLNSSGDARDLKRNGPYLPTPTPFMINKAPHLRIPTQKTLSEHAPFAERGKDVSPLQIHSQLLHQKQKGSWQL